MRGHLEWGCIIDEAGIGRCGVDVMSGGWVGWFIHHQAGNQKAHLCIVIKLQNIWLYIHPLSHVVEHLRDGSGSDSFLGVNHWNQTTNHNQNRHHHHQHYCFAFLHHQYDIFTWGGNQAAETAAGAEATTMPGIPFRIAATWQRIVNKLSWTKIYRNRKEIF